MRSDDDDDDDDSILHYVALYIAVSIASCKRSFSKLKLTLT